MRRRSQTIKATRLLMINAWGPMQLPWFILGLSFVVNLTIFAVGQSAIEPAARVTGGLSSIYVLAVIANLQTWTQTFPLALGLSITRRSFLGGIGIVMIAQSMLVGLGLLALKGIEIATSGWGLSVRFFALPYVSQDSVIAQFLVYALPYLALSALGSAIGVVFKRWGQLGMYAVMAGTIVLGGGAVSLATWRDWWTGIGDFLSGTDSMTLMTAYPALIALALAGATFVVARRATP